LAIGSFDFSKLFQCNWVNSPCSFYYFISIFFSYELINEPWAGNYLADPTLILPGVAGAKNLQPLYEKIAKAIRSVDNNTLIFYEPVTWSGRSNLQ
jgi:hypothetical protein